MFYGRRLIEFLISIDRKVEALMAQIDDLKAALDAQTTVINSFQEGLDSIAATGQQIVASVKAIQNAQVSGSGGDLTDAIAEANANTQALQSKLAILTADNAQAVAFAATLVPGQAGPVTPVDPVTGLPVGTNPPSTATGTPGAVPGGSSVAPAGTPAANS